MENKEKELTIGKLYFCKTARKIYDRYVKEALMIIQRITNNKLEVSCDDNFYYYSDKIEKSDEITATKKVYNNLNEIPEGNYSWQEN